MKKFSVYANCQSVALAKTLLDDPCFRDRYELVEIKPVHTLNQFDLKDVHQKVCDLDLFVYQPFGGRGVEGLSSDALLSELPDKCVALSFPPLYFDGYFPQLEMFPEIKSPLNLVHDFFIMKFYLDGLSKSDCIQKVLSKDLIRRDLAISYFERSIERLANREKANCIDLPVSTFIKSNSKKYKLFNQFNHPKKPVFQYLKNKILEKIKVDASDSTLDWFGSGYLDGIRCPSLLSMSECLNFEFVEDKFYFSFGSILTLDNIVDGFYKSYQTVERDMLSKAIFEKKREVVSLLEI